MAVRRAALKNVFKEIYDREPAITSADVLLEFARRNQIARHHRVNRKDAADDLRPKEGRKCINAPPLNVQGGSLRTQKPTQD